LSTEVTQNEERLKALVVEAQTLQSEIMPGARSAYEAASKGFELGKFSFLEVLDAQRTFFQARAQYLRSLSDAHRTAAELERVWLHRFNVICSTQPSVGARRENEFQQEHLQSHQKARDRHCRDLGDRNCRRHLDTGGSTSQPAGEQHEHASHAEAKGHADAEHHGSKAGDGHDHAKEHGDTEHHEDEPKSGPHGGKFFTEDGFGLELLLSEDGGEPGFRVWLFQQGKPLAPTAAKVSITLTRPGEEKQEVLFQPRKTI
jgi:hypothetical protein